MPGYVKFCALGLCLFLHACQMKFSPMLYSIERWRSNLSAKTLQIQDFEISYLSGGQGEAVMLVHGFGANKDTWVRFSRPLTTNYRVYAIDLPGFGDSSRVENVSYTIEDQVRRLEEIRLQLGIERMHLVGNSMGSSIATVYATKHSDRLLSLTFINSGGIVSPVLSDHQRGLSQGVNSLLVENRADFERLLEYTFVNPPYIPATMIDEFYLKSRENRQWNESIIEQINLKNNITADYLPAVKTPLLVIWGDQDRITHVSAIEIIKKLQPTASFVIIPNSGHAPMIEHVKESSQAFLNFAKQTSERG